MKRAGAVEVISIDDEEDEDFLSQIAAAEVQALSTATTTKRFKSTTTTTTASTTTTLHPQPKQETPLQQGAYLAALRGDDTGYRCTSSNAKYNHLQSRVAKGTRLKVVADDSELGFGGPNVGSKLGDSGNEDDVPEKACPCGLGTCLVLTANTERNRGRKFYKCPIREENGGCGFFEWCDNASGSASMTRLSYNSMHNSPFPDLPCSCGAGSCLILTAKTENNFGRQFYRCPGNQGASCGFFKWCNDNSAEASHSTNSSNIHNNLGDSAGNSYGVRTTLACFKCGKEGHWAKDCSFNSSGFCSNLGAKQSSGGKQSSGSCYKCGKPGHWAKDCAPSSAMNMRQRQ